VETLSNKARRIFQWLTDHPDEEDEAIDSDLWLDHFAGMYANPFFLYFISISLGSEFFSSYFCCKLIPFFHDSFFSFLIIFVQFKLFLLDGNCLCLFFKLVIITLDIHAFN